MCATRERGAKKRKDSSCKARYHMTTGTATRTATCTGQVVQILLTSLQDQTHRGRWRCWNLSGLAPSRSPLALRTPLGSTPLVVNSLPSTVEWPHWGPPGPETRVAATVAQARRPRAHAAGAMQKARRYHLGSGSRRVRRTLPAAAATAAVAAGGKASDPRADCACIEGKSSACAAGPR